MRKTLRTATLVAALATVAVSAGAQGTGPRAYVLDQGALTLSVIDLVTGAAGQTARLEGAPMTLLRSANGQRLVVLDRGQGRDAGDAGFQAKTKSTVTILDGRTLAVQARVELGSGLDDAPMLSVAGDRLSVLCPGYRGKTAAENQAREFVTVDLAAGKVLSRVELTREPSAYFATPDGRTGLVLSPRETPKKAPVIPAELRFLDLTAGAITATVALEGDPGGPVLAPDGKFVYLLDVGKPNGNPEKNVNGKLHAVSMATRTVEAVSDAGSNPRGLALDERGAQLLMLSNSAPFKGPGNDERPGELRIIRGATPAPPIAVVGLPQRVDASSDGKAWYVLGRFGVTRLTIPGLQPSPTIKADFIGEDESAISADGRRGWVSLGETFRTFDLEKGVKLDDVKTGRASKKLWLGVVSAAKTHSSMSSGRRDAEAQGRSDYSYTIYTVRPAVGALAVAPGDKAVYVLNSMTDDLTVVDGQTGQVLKKIPAGGFAVRFMPSASAALVVASDNIHVVDLASHEKLANLATDATADFSRAELSPDATLAVIQGTSGVMVVNAASGKLVGTLVPFKKVVDMAIDWGARR